MYLEKLNPQQRMAVEHGTLTEGSHVAGPLLVIAGAGSGKTNTLAHRVAHLIVKGADPRRILLMTFSRRAASEMARRVERICAEVLGANSGIMADALAWSGTFHGIGARLLRDYAEQIGVDPAFTIHDREDSADLMNIVRHDLGFSKTENRFPTKGTCLAIYSRVVNSEGELPLVLRDAFPWCATWENQLRELFGAYVEAKQAQNVLDYDDLLLYWAQMVAEPMIAEDIGSRFDHVLVDEYQDTNRLQSSILLALKPDGQGLTVVGDDAQSIYSFRAATVRNILDFPASFTPAANIVTLDRNYRSTQPILAAANAVIDLASERFTKNLWTERQSAERPRLVTVRDEADQARFVADKVLENREEGVKLKSQAVLFRASHHSGALEVELTRRNIPFVKFGGLKFLDSAHVKDMLAALRFALNPRDRVAGFRLMQILPGVGPSTAQKTLDHMAADPSPIQALAELAAPPRSGDDWTAFVSVMQELKTGKAGWPAEIGLVREWYQPHLERLHEDASTRQAVPDAAGADRRRLSFPRALPDGADARSAGCDQRSGRRAAARRGLSHPLHHPFGQGAGMDQGVHAERRGRLHSLRPRCRHQRRDRGGAAAPLCRDDAGEGQSRSRRAAALLHARPEYPGRPSCLCRPHPLHSGDASAVLRSLRLAAGQGRDGGQPARASGADRCRRAHARHVALGPPKAPEV